MTNGVNVLKSFSIYVTYRILFGFNWGLTIHKYHNECWIRYNWLKCSCQHNCWLPKRNLAHKVIELIKLISPAYDFLAWGIQCINQMKRNELASRKEVYQLSLLRVWNERSSTQLPLKHRPRWQGGMLNEDLSRREGVRERRHNLPGPWRDVN